MTRENYQEELKTNGMMRLKGNHYTEMNEESLSCVSKSRQICKIMNGYTLFIVGSEEAPFTLFVI